MFSVLSALAPRPVPTSPVPRAATGAGSTPADVAVVTMSLDGVALDLPWAAYGDAVGLALLDAVFAIRTTYGSPTTGVRAWVAACADVLDDTGAAVDLERVAGSGDVLHGLADDGRVTRQRLTGGTLKIDAAVAAAEALQACGSVTTLGSQAYVEARHRFTGVAGLGVVSFEYFLLLAGAPGELARAAAAAHLSGALGREVREDECRALLQLTARDLGLAYDQLLHAVWRHAQRR